MDLTKKSKAHDQSFQMVFRAACLIALLMEQSLHALPTGITGKDVTKVEQKTDGGITALQITLAGSKPTVDIQSLSCVKDESVHFKMDSAATALASVTGGGTSLIYGILKADGSLILVSPGGIFFDSAAQVNVAGGFMAATGILSKADFLAGKYVFTIDQKNLTSAIINQGIIRGDKFVALMAHRVENSGTITVPTGSVVLASGKVTTLGFSPDGKMLQVAVNTPEGSYGAQTPHLGGDAIKHTGKIEGKTIQLTENNIAGIFDRAINVNGYVEMAAGKAEKVGGELVLNGSSVNLSGMVAAKDGTIKVFADGNKSTIGNLSTTASLKLGARSSTATYQATKDSIIQVASLGIGEKTKLQANNAKIDVHGDWENNNGGTFEAGTSKVSFKGLETAHIKGSTTFHELSITQPDKTIIIDSGSTQTILGALTLKGEGGKNGSAAHFVTLESSTHGKYWKIDPQGKTDISFVQVSYSDNISGKPIVAHFSRANHTKNWDPTSTWTGAVDTSWLNAGNWLMGVMPDADNVIIFDDINITGTKNSIMDMEGIIDPDTGLPTTFTIGSLQLKSGYTGTLTLAKDLIILTGQSPDATGKLTLSGGTLDINGFALAVSGDVLFDGGTLNFTKVTGVDSAMVVGGNWNSTGSGTLNAGSGTVFFYDNGKDQTLTSGGKTFNNIVHASQNKLILLDSLMVNNLTNDHSLLPITGLPAGNISMNDAATTLSVTGNLILKDGGLEGAKNGVIAFTGSSTQNFDAGKSGLHLGSIDHTGNGTLTLVNSDVILDGAFQNKTGAGNVIGGGQKMSLAGNFTVEAGAGSVSDLSLDFTNADSLLVQGFTPGQSSVFDNITHSGAAGLTLIGGNLSAKNLTNTASAGYLDINGGAIVLTGDLTLLSKNLQGTAGSTISFVGNGTHNLLSGGNNLESVSLSDGGVLNLNDDLTINTGGFQSINTSVLNMGGHTMSLLTGNFSVNSPVLGNGTVEFNSVAAQTFFSSVKTTGLSVKHTGTGLLSLSAAATQSDFGVKDFTSAVGAGQFDLVGKEMDVTGDLTLTGSNTFVANPSKIQFSGSGKQTLTSSGTSFANITHTGTGSLYLADALKVNDFTNDTGDLHTVSYNMDVINFLINGGSMHLEGDSQLTVDGDLMIGSGGSFDGNSNSILIFTGSAPLIPQTLKTSNTSTFGNITLGASTLNLDGNLKLRGNLIIPMNGTLNAAVNTKLVQVGGNWSNSGAFSIADANQTTVEFTGDQSKSIISGNTTFYNLKCVAAGKELDFDRGTTTTVKNNLILIGGRSSSITVAANGNVGAAPELIVGKKSTKTDKRTDNNVLQFLNVKNINATNGGTLYTEGDSVDSFSLANNWVLLNRPPLPPEPPPLGFRDIESSILFSSVHGSTSLNPEISLDTISFSESASSENIGGSKNKTILVAQVPKNKMGRVSRTLLAAGNTGRRPSKSDDNDNTTPETNPPKLMPLLAMAPGVESIKREQSQSETLGALFTPSKSFDSQLIPIGKVVE